MYLRRIQESDLKDRVMWMNNAAIYPSMGFTPPISLENTVNWYRSNLANNKRVDCAFVNEHGELLAMAGLTGIDYSCRKAELYLFVNPNRQRQGLGKKATYLLCKYGFNVLHLNKVYLFTNATNIGAQRVYENVGFKLEGTHRQERVAGGRFEDRLYYGLLANEFDYDRMPLQIIGDSTLITENIKLGGVIIKVVRDDLYPFIGGGSKARKAVAYEQYLREGGYNAVVTCGGVQSNHNRAMALMCARNGWKCHLCIQGTEERFMTEKGNALLDRLCGAECELIRPEDTAVAMDRAMEKLRSEGYNPFYVVGGGHNLPGGTCFVDAVRELKRQCDETGYKPDYIYLASGTGSTQAGIVVGLDLVGWSDVKCVGISVARQQERGKQVIAEFANMLATHYGLQKDYTESILFNTDYLCGGYEQYTTEMKTYLEDTMRKTGLMFDTTYSGKGFYGMMQEIKKLHLEDKNIVFWHTGGLMNIMK